MMKQLLMVAVVVFGLLVVQMQPVHAAGIGFYAELGGGSGEAEWDDDYQEFDVDLTSGGFGFALDTAPGSNKVFSYRLLAGYAAQTLEDDFDVELELEGIRIENQFAFGIVRRPDLRLWAGPLVGFGLFSGETDNYETFPGYRERLEFDSFWEFGFGGVVGANLKLADSLILAPSVGFRYLLGGGEGEYRETETATGFTTYYTDDLSFYATTAFINLTLLFD